MRRADSQRERKGSDVHFDDVFDDKASIRTDDFFFGRNDSLRSSVDARRSRGSISSIASGTTIMSSSFINNDIDSHYGTALHVACSQGDYGLVLELIKANSNIHAKDEYKRTPLHRACHNGNRDIIRTLLANGAEVEAKDKEKSTPLRYACRYAKIDAVMELLNHGAYIYSGCNIYGVPLPKFILKYEKDVNGDTILHIGIKRGYRQLVAYMLEIEADPQISKDMPKPSTIRNREGYLPIDLVIRNGDKHLVEKIMKLHGKYNPNSLNVSYGVTALGSNTSGLIDLQVLMKSLQSIPHHDSHIHLLGNDLKTKTAFVKMIKNFYGQQKTNSWIPFTAGISFKQSTKGILSKAMTTHRIQTDGITKILYEYQVYIGHKL